MNSRTAVTIRNTSKIGFGIKFFASLCTIATAVFFLLARNTRAALIALIVGVLVVAGAWLLKKWALGDIFATGYLGALLAASFIVVWQIALRSTLLILYFDAPGMEITVPSFPVGTTIFLVSFTAASAASVHWLREEWSEGRL